MTASNRMKLLKMMVSNIVKYAQIDTKQGALNTLTRPQADDCNVRKKFVVLASDSGPPICRRCRRRAC